ncbi:MAG: hypothetical protein HN392_03720 [Anaerolineae bacterium]|jgi:hypothetical protein|nr:hypothetical protein [Anaerolineae bacterium]MBT7073454.1 hypothetical protein [Anaerolineae bacterium]MBT7782878.1 hypothetical protein [Anaerolineae bacterium]
MKKSALIVGGIAFIFSAVLTLVSPFLLPCITPFLGISAGYITGLFEPSYTKKDAIKMASKAAAFAGLGMLVGQVFGAVMNGLLVGPDGAALVLESFGMPAGPPEQMANIYWLTLTLSTACISLFNIALMAALGALGGLLWWQFSGKENLDKSEISENVE